MLIQLDNEKYMVPWCEWFQDKSTTQLILLLDEPTQFLNIE